MHYIGVDIGGTNISAGVVDENYEIINKASCKTNAPRPAQEICDSIINLISQLLEQTNLTLKEIPYIGVGCPGSIDSKNGILQYSNNLFLRNWNIKKDLQEKLHKDIFLENDANLAALGEFIAGNAKNSKSSITITIGTGIGGGIILNGKIYSGFNFNGAELGHMVIKKGGRACTCGRLGCWEAYASAPGLILTIKENLRNLNKKETEIWEIIENNIKNIGGRTLFNAIKKGDKAAENIFNKYIEDFSCGLTNIINIFQPEIITIGGGISHEGDILLQPIIRYVKRDRYSQAALNQTEIKIAKLQNAAGIIGAALINKIS